MPEAELVVCLSVTLPLKIRFEAISITILRRSAASLRNSLTACIGIKQLSPHSTVKSSSFSKTKGVSPNFLSCLAITVLSTGLFCASVTTGPSSSTVVLSSPLSHINSLMLLPTERKAFAHIFSLTSSFSLIYLSVISFIRLAHLIREYIPPAFEMYFAGTCMVNSSPLAISLPVVRLKSSVISKTSPRYISVSALKVTLPAAALTALTAFTPAWLGRCVLIISGPLPVI